MKFSGLIKVKVPRRKGLRDLPQYKDDKNRELSLLRIRKEKERLLTERDKWEEKLKSISDRLAEIAIMEEPPQKRPMNRDSETFAEETILRY